MTPLPAHDAAAIAEIAKGLTKAQITRLLNGPSILSDKGRVRVRTALQQKGLIEPFPISNLTPLGLAVRASLAQSKGEE